MFKSLQSDNSIPNNYVYTSNRGTEYMYLEGSWVNCETMKIVENAHTFKMNQSAIRQIAEHNKKSSLQIGKSYVINESEYTYIGRNNFSLQGNLLSESMNTRIQQLVEAENTPEFSDLKFGDKENVSLPPPHGFTLDGGDYKWSDKGYWWGKDQNANGQTYTGKVQSKDLIRELNKDAYDKIQHYNKTDPIPVGTTVNYKGTPVTWNGDYFYSEKTGKLPDTVWHKFETYFEDNYNRDGTPKSSDENTQDQSTDQPTDDQSQDQNSNDSDTSQGSNTDSSTEVPNGYVYKSKKGNSYYKKNGQWFNAATKKPINSSSVPMLERSAQAEISKFNSSSPVKIGQEFKSKKGITYRYVGGNRFISDNGKLLPPDVAQKVLANLSQKPSDENSPDGQPQGEPQDQSQGSNTDSSTPEGQPEQSSSNDSQDAPEGDDPLQALANEIKSSPLARKIVVLLSRGDDLSLLAADIMLSGQQKEATEILKSLNNED